jgi:hypothetical protein
MFSWSEPDDRVAIVQLNAQLRHAQLELLSAQCASDQLRLRFAAADVARHAQPDVLQRAVKTATALYNYYTSIARGNADTHETAAAGSD